MSTLVTGAAGFIGSHVCHRLLDRGEAVVGIDNMNDYYDRALKQARLEQLLPRSGFRFRQADIAERETFDALKSEAPIRRIVHLAAQTGVRYSLDNPRAYIRSNVAGHLEVLEFARYLNTLDQLVYASSSSVYGGNTKVPFSEDDRVDQPVSLYAATKKADKLMSHTYAHLYGIPQTGLRFFTVYGPWGRPDMAYWIFTKAILEGKPIRVFNNGEMWRDFTYIDDIVDGVVSVLDARAQGSPPHRIFNFGNNRPCKLVEMIGILENLLGRKAKRVYETMQPGDVERTYADIEKMRQAVDFAPRTDLAAGLAAFVEWYRGWVPTARPDQGSPSG